MKTLNTTLSLLIICFTLLSCGDDRDDVAVSAPTDFTYPAGGPIPFYTNGNSGTPTINWNNDIGIFTLDNAYVGIGIDESTGVLSWNEDLPLNNNLVDVTATNSAGTAHTSVLFIHQFSGGFDGGHNLDPTSTTVTTTNLTATFNVDGSASYTDNGETVSGTWFFNLAGKLICDYTLLSGAHQLELDLTYNLTTIPYLEGFKRLNGSATNIGFVRLDYQ